MSLEKLYNYMSKLSLTEKSTFIGNLAEKHSNTYIWYDNAVCKATAIYDPNHPMMHKIRNLKKAYQLLYVYLKASREYYNNLHPNNQ